MININRKMNVIGVETKYVTMAKNILKREAYYSQQK